MWVEGGKKKKDNDDAETNREEPLKCVVCDGTLILNAKVLGQHMKSKKHKKSVEAVKKDGYDDVALFQLFAFAADYDAAMREEAEEEEVETYLERMQRVEDALKKAKESDGDARKKKKKKGDGDDQEEEEDGDDKKTKGQADVMRRKRRMKKKGQKRPGKRQRQAMKEGGKKS